MLLVALLFIAVTICFFAKEIIVVSRSGVKGRLSRNTNIASVYLKSLVAGVVSMIVGGYSYALTVETEWFPATLISLTLITVGALVVALTTFLADRRDNTDEIATGG